MLDGAGRAQNFDKQSLRGLPLFLATVPIPSKIVIIFATGVSLMGVEQIRDHGPSERYNLQASRNISIKNGRTGSGEAETEKKKKKEKKKKQKEEEEEEKE